MRAPLTTSAQKTLARTLVSSCGVTLSQARNAINTNWMLLATANVTDWRQVTADPYGDEMVSIVEGDRLLATIYFPKGQIVTEHTKAMAELDAYNAANPIPWPSNDDDGDDLDAMYGIVARPQIKLNEVIGAVTDCRPYPLDENCVEIEVTPEDGTPIRTMVMLPWIHNAGELLAYAESVMRDRSRILYCATGDSSIPAPRTIPANTDICEFVLPAYATRAA